MKKSIIAVACVGAVVLAAPYITGSIAETETRNMTAELNKSPNEYGTTNIVSYDRGYGSSQISYEYTLPAILAKAFDYEGTVLYDCDYSHGFVGIDYDCNFRSNAGYQKFVEEEFAGDDPILITGGISAFGGFTQKLATKSIDKVVDGTAFKVAASEIVIDSDSSFSDYDGTAEFGAIEIVDEKQSMVLSASEMDFSVQATEWGIYVGDYSVSLDSIDMVAEDNKTKMENFTVSGFAKERGDKIDSSAVFKVGAMAVEGASGGKVEDATLTMDILGVDAQAMAEYQEFARNMQSELLGSLDETGGEQPSMDPMQMMGVLPILEKMLDKDLNIKMSFNGDIMDKPNSINIDVKLLDKLSFTQLSGFMFDPESVLKNFDIKLAASVDKELANSNPMVGPKMGQSPLFEADGSAYETDIRIGEKSKVNGKEVSFQELQGMLMSSAM